MKTTLEMMQKIAQERGGKCLSTEYKSCNLRLHWRCSKGHTWHAIVNNVVRGAWCPHCAGVAKGTIEEMQSFAEKHGGQCLSIEYKNSKSTLLWQCKNGHKWEAKACNIKKKWRCPTCSPAKNKPLTLDNIKRNAEERGGRCLSDKYINTKIPILWECKKGHRWKMSPGAVRGGEWCPDCGGTKKLTIEEMKKIAEERGGKCLSDEYSNGTKKLEWQCYHGHKWKAAPPPIKRGHWCPECCTGLGERICREYFEQLFNEEFPSARPSWLVGENGRPLELDGYSESAGIAFEHQGRQHYEARWGTRNKNSNLHEIQRRDKIKYKLCKKNNVILFLMPEIPTLLPIKEIKDFIKQECKTKKTPLPKEFEKKEVNLRKAYCSSALEEKFKNLSEFMHLKGGMLLSPQYMGSSEHHLLKCENGHIWEAVPAAVRHGSWCPHCAGNAKLSIDNINLYAKSKGGKCLSKEYININSKLSWQCQFKHKWEASAASVIKNQHWCPNCAGVMKKTIEDMRLMAHAHGGECLSNEYINNRTKLLWKCKEGHQWKAPPYAIKNNKWCRICFINSQKLTIEEIDEIANLKGGRCLSKLYINSYTKLDFQCAVGHQWKSTPSNIRKGRWCPECYKESVVRIGH